MQKQTKKKAIETVRGYKFWSIERRHISLIVSDVFENLFLEN